MNTNKLQSFAAEARTSLMKAVRARIDAALEPNSLAQSDSPRAYRELTEEIQRNGGGEQGRAKTAERHAYRWFNRIIALRYMDANEFTGVHVVSGEELDNPNALPAVLSAAKRGEFEDEIFGGVGTKSKVLPTIQALLDGGKPSNDPQGDAYGLLLRSYCDYWHKCLPFMFDDAGAADEILMPADLLAKDSVLRKAVEVMSVADCVGESDEGNVEIIGWLYQYYNDERKNEVINIYKGTVKKEDIPAATQLFTTDWVVRYMVDNSLGRYWIERHPESKLSEKLEFFVTPKNGEINHIDEFVKPEDVKFLDPCMGSGHILVYAFDVLMEIYKESGYTERDAAAMIVQNNLFGLDIDDRASQLAYFAVMMKARSYDRRFLSRGIKPNVLAIKESNGMGAAVRDGLTTDVEMNAISRYLMDTFRDAKELGSIITVEPKDYDGYVAYLDGCDGQGQLTMDDADWLQNTRPMLKALARQAKVLAAKYPVVCTNPPYLNKIEGRLKTFVTENYKDYSGDLFSVFTYRNLMFCKQDGYCGYMTPFVWMFIKTYEKLREFIIRNKSIATLVQMEYSAFEEATVPICSFVLNNGKATENGLYFKLSDFKGGMEVQKQKVLEALANKNCGYFYETNQSNFSKIPGSPLAYWVSDSIFNSFCRNKVDSIAFSDGQILTGDNDKYLRMLWEVEATEIRKDGKWMLHAKGGEYRKWSGNLEWVVKWSPSAIEHYKHDKIARFPKDHILFRKGVTWSLVSTNPTFGARLLPESQTFNKAAATVLFHDEKYVLYVLALLNSSVVNYLSKIINPTLNNNIKDILAMPFIYNIEKAPRILEFVNENIEKSQNDWNSDETSWDFKRSPLV